MFSLFGILVFIAFAINTLAFPHNPWPLRPNEESAPVQVRDESAPLDKRNSDSPRKTPNFSLPLQPKSDTDSPPLRARTDSSPSPLSPRNFSFPLRARDGNVSSIIPEGPNQPFTPGIDATVFDANGTDITSAFQIMIYREIPPISNLNGKRQVASVRYINTCKSKTAVFRSSNCIAGQGLDQASTVQQHITWCRERSQHGSQRTSRYIPAHSEFGFCNSNEVCINGKTSHDVGAASMARCVLKRAFQPLEDPHIPTSAAFAGGAAQGAAESSAQPQGAASNPEQGAAGSSTQGAAGSSAQGSMGYQQQISVNLGGLMASTVVSLADGVTPVEMETLEVDSGEAGTVAADGTVQNTTCQECTELSTSTFPQDTNFVMTKAKLITTVLATGVLWLAFFS